MQTPAQESSPPTQSVGGGRQRQADDQVNLTQPEGQQKRVEQRYHAQHKAQPNPRRQGWPDHPPRQRRGGQQREVVHRQEDQPGGRQRHG